MSTLMQWIRALRLLREDSKRRKQALEDFDKYNRPILDIMGIDPSDLAKLYDEFRLIDADFSGAISFEELSSYFGIGNVAFAKTLYNFVDRDGSGELDFVEFAVAMWNYCTISYTAMASFIFDLIDVDQSGELDFNEMLILLRAVYANRSEGDLLTMCKGLLFKEGLLKSGRKQALREFRMRRSEFQKFASKQISVLAPAYELQSRVL